MDQRTINEMVERLEAVERSLELARTEINTLRHAARETKHARAAVICLSTAIVIAVGSFGRWSVAHAQGQTIRAPFEVVGRNGQKLLSVFDRTDLSTGINFYGGGEQLAVEIAGDKHGG